MPRSLRDHAREIGARFEAIGEAFSYVAHASSWDWTQGRRKLLALPLPGIAGDAQLRNAAGVIAAITALQGRMPVSESAIRAALPMLALRGRFERKGRVIFDVAHNAEAARVLAARLAQELPGRRLHIVLGMLADKPVEAFCEALAACAAHVYCAGLPPPRGLAAAILVARVRSTGLGTSGFADVAGAMDAALAAAGEEDQVLVTGSFLTVAEGLAHG